MYSNTYSRPPLYAKHTRSLGMFAVKRLSEGGRRGNVEVNDNFIWAAKMLVPSNM